MSVKIFFKNTTNLEYDVKQDVELYKSILDNIKRNEDFMEIIDEKNIHNSYINVSEICYVLLNSGDGKKE